MKKNRYFTRVLMLILGTCCISFGIAVMSKADIGMSPISSFPFVLSKALPTLTLGNYVLLWNMLFALLQIPVLGKNYKLYYLLQIPLAFLLGYVTDLAKWIISPMELSVYPLKLLGVFIGILFTALGVYLTVRADLIMNGPEAFLHSLSSRMGKEFGTLKMTFDICNVLAAVTAGLLIFHKLVGIREGTILSAILTGVFVNLISKIVNCKSDKTRNAAE